MARQFDVFRTHGDVLVVVIQNDLLDAIQTRVVMPMLPAGAAGRPMRGLNPEIGFAGKPLVLMPQLLATLAISELGERQGSVAHLRDEVIRALDMLLAGV